MGTEVGPPLVVQDQIDGGQRQGSTSDEPAEIRELQAKVRQFEEDNAILRRASILAASTTTDHAPLHRPSRTGGHPPVHRALRTRWWPPTSRAL
jgi:hypothetical protein